MWAEGGALESLEVTEGGLLSWYEGLSERSLGDSVRQFIELNQRAVGLCMLPSPTRR